MRSFARLYNEIKHNPRAYERIDPKLRKNLRFTYNVESAYRRAIKELRAELPHYSLSEIISSTKQQLQVFYKLPGELVSPYDESMEPVIRKVIKKEIMDPLVENQIEKLEDSLFLLDRSLESRRNVLLSLEIEEVLKQERIRQEVERRKIISGEEVSKILGSEYTKYLSVDLLLDEKEQNELVKVEENELISAKGVIELPRKPGKRPRFEDLTPIELSCYVCYNLKSADQAAALYKYAHNSPNFEEKTFAQLIQKYCFLCKEPDKIIHNWVHALKVEKLEKKELVDTAFVVSHLFKHNFPTKLKEKLIETCLEHLENFNSMNLNYFIKSLNNFKYKNDEIPSKILKKFQFFLEEVELPETRQDPFIQYFDLPVQGHSLFSGFTDRTIPITSLPSQALIQISKYLYTHLPSPETFSMIRKSAEILYWVSLPEFSFEHKIEALQFFGFLNEYLMSTPEIRKLIEELAIMVYSDVELVPQKEIGDIGEAIMNSGEFRMSGLFRALRNKALELVTVEMIGLVDTTAMLTRYYIACHHGVDISIEPFAFVWKDLEFTSEFLIKVKEQCEVFPVPEIDKISYFLALAGEFLLYEEEFNIQTLINEGLYKERKVEVEKEVLMEMIHEEEDIERICELVVSLSIVNAKVDWEYLGELIESNIHLVSNQSYLIGAIWALHQEKVSITANLDPDLFTATDSFLLSSINKT